MKQKIAAESHFTNEFEGELLLKEGSVAIGVGPTKLSPYRMLQGALMACFHSTFLDIINKKRVTFSSVSYKTHGEKREEVPSTIENLHMDIFIQGASNHLAVEKSYELATRVCSVYVTLSQLADMSYTIHFEDKPL